MGRLLLLDVIRPDYSWLYATHATPRLYERLRALRDPAGFADIERVCDTDARMLPSDRRQALNQLTRMLVHNGGTLAEITLPDCIEAHRAQDGYRGRCQPRWYTLLREAAILPADSPPTIFAAARRGQLTIEEMVDRYDVVCHPVRDLLVAYLYERRPAMDYNSIRYLAAKLVLLFWRDLGDPRARHRLPAPVRRGCPPVEDEAQRPGSVRQQPRREEARGPVHDPHGRSCVLRRPVPLGTGGPRPMGGMGGALAGRLQGPGRNDQDAQAVTVAHAPAHPGTRTPASTARRRGPRQPSCHADSARCGRRDPPGESFTVEGQTLRRASLSNIARTGSAASRGYVYVDAPARSGTSDRPQDKRRNLSLEADRAFWAWALVEVLRHTGARIEEVLEITHRSFVSYRLPSTGEVIPMLQITPSKTDKERLLVIGPELAVAFAEIISRVRGGNERLPLVSRYDSAERVHSPELPFLFQRPWGTGRIAINSTYAVKLLDELVATAKITNTDGTPAKFSPHDFRRIFATEAVASGLPVHITATDPRPRLRSRRRRPTSRCTTTT